MDFRCPYRIGDRVADEFQALLYGGGYDHCWVLDRPKHRGLATAARLEDPRSGRVLTIRSNQPAVQFYDGNFLDGTVKGKSGTAYKHRTALCLETENFPDPKIIPPSQHPASIPEKPTGTRCSTASASINPAME